MTTPKDMLAKIGATQAQITAATIARREADQAREAAAYAARKARREREGANLSAWYESGMPDDVDRYTGHKLVTESKEYKQQRARNVR